MEASNEAHQSVFNASRFHLRSLADIDRKLRLLEKHIGIGADPTQFVELSPSTLHEMFTLTASVLTRIRERVDNLCRQVLPRPDINEFITKAREIPAPPADDLTAYIDTGLGRLKEDIQRPGVKEHHAAKPQAKKTNGSRKE